MVYFIKSGDFIKIGTTTDIKKRMAVLQVGSPFKLSVLALVEGSFEEESKLHTKFKKQRMKGEWFKINKKILDYISKLSKDAMWFHGFVSEPFIPMGRIKEARIKNNMSLKSFADELGITKQSAMEIELREIHGRITLNTIRRAAKGLGLKFDYRIV